MQNNSGLSNLALFAYLGFIWLMTSCLPVAAQVNNPLEVHYPIGTRFVTTSGSEEIYATPNRAKVIIGVRTWDKNLNTASTQNNASMNAIIGLTSKYHIDSKDVQTGRVEVQPTYPVKRSENGRPEGYQVNKSLTVIVKNLDDVPGLLRDVLDAGANYVESVTFDIDNIQLHKYENEATAKAVQVAQQKAEAIASQSNAKLGKALLIRENHTDITNLSGQVFRAQILNRGPEVPTPMSPVAPGQLKVDASVTVTYELVD